MKYHLLRVADRPGTYELTSKTVTEDDIMKMAKQISVTRLRKGRAIARPADTFEYLRVLLHDYEHEVFGMLFLDTSHRVISYEHIFRGTIDGASVHPREVVKRALHHNAGAVIFFHNHPSGVPEPSAADERLTIRLRDALSLVEIPVLDHVVVGVDGIVSFAERVV